MCVRVIFVRILVPSSLRLIFFNHRFFFSLNKQKYNKENSIQLFEPIILYINYDGQMFNMTFYVMHAHKSGFMRPTKGKTENIHSIDISFYWQILRKSSGMFIFHRNHSNVAYWNRGAMCSHLNRSRVVRRCFRCGSAVYLCVSLSFPFKHIWY